MTNELVSVAAAGDWRTFHGLAYHTSKDTESGLTSGEDMPVKTAVSAELMDAIVPQGGYFMLRWRRSAAANAAAIAIDNVSVAFSVRSRPLTIVVR